MESNEIIHVVIVIKGREKYIFNIVGSRGIEGLECMSSFVRREELSFNQHDLVRAAASLAKSIRMATAL